MYSRMSSREMSDRRSSGVSSRSSSSRERGASVEQRQVEQQGASDEGADDDDGVLSLDTARLYAHGQMGSGGQRHRPKGAQARSGPL